MIEHKFLDSLPLYAAGALNASEAAELEQHLKEGCALCEPELWIQQESLSRIPFALPNHPLPPTLKQKIRQQIDQEFPAPKAASSSRSWIGRVAAIVIIALLASLLWRQERILNDKEKQIAEIRTLVKQQQEEIDWLRDPSVQLAMLSGLDAAPQAKGKMVWSPSESRGIFYANLLPAAQTGKTYQLWVIGASGPVSAGVFDPNATGSAVVIISPIQDASQGINQCAVTIEPRGGVPQPTGSMVLAGKLL